MRPTMPLMIRQEQVRTGFWTGTGPEAFWQRQPLGLNQDQDCRQLSRCF